MKKYLSICLMLISLVTISCGTTGSLESENKVKNSAESKPVILKGVGTGLVLFYTPGVLSFAVDVDNGVIYLPGKNDKITKLMRSLSPKSEGLNKAFLKIVVRKALGLSRDFEIDSMNVIKIDVIKVENIYQY